MATFFLLLNYTSRGHKDVLEAPKRTDEAKQNFKAFGVTLRECYAVTGQYDEIAIIEAPSDEHAARAAHLLCSMGNVNVQTLRAFTSAEHKAILADVAKHRPASTP